MRICFCIVFLSLMVLPLRQVHALPAMLSGSAELRYANHSAEENGVDVLDASHFVQKYSLLWSREGVIRDGRLGAYDVSLGYEWSWIDTEINGSEVKIENPLDKILFKGDVTLAPGGLPFRMHLYSRDLESSHFSYQELGELFHDQDFDTHNGIITSFSNGSHITTGLTLVAGIQNGSYRGQYRDLLMTLPRLFIDFRQDEVRDLKGPAPREYTDRNLAFVSLNKNKNWFHFRLFTHEDKLDPLNNYESKTFLIGTIDHVNRRQWIDLTNWIQVSTDISYSETDPNPGAGQTLQKRYDYNLFTTSQRSDWRGGAYLNFSRVREDRSLEKAIDVPIFANGRLNRDTTWRIRLENRHEEKDFFSSADDRSESNIYLASRLDMYSHSRYMVSPLLDLEHKESDLADGRALRVGVEAYTNRRYRTDRDSFGSYTLSMFDGVSDAGMDSSYWEQRLEGRYSLDLTSDLRTGFSQVLTYGSGKYSEDVSEFLQADASILAAKVGGGNLLEDDYYRSVTRWYADYRPASRIYNRLELSYDYINSSFDSGGQFTTLHNLDYFGRNVTLSIDNELIIGSSLYDSFNLDVDVVSSTDIGRQSGTVTSSFESRSRLSYDPDRSHHNDLKFEAEWRGFEKGGSDQRYKVTQLYEHAFWKDRGLLRKIAMLGEEFEYENYSPSLGGSSSLVTFTLLSELYPTRQTLLSAKLRYEYDTVAETGTSLAFLSAGIDFEKFQLELDYAYGTRTAGISRPERVEHKWEMRVKKIF